MIVLHIHEASEVAPSDYISVTDLSSYIKAWNKVQIALRQPDEEAKLLVQADTPWEYYLEIILADLPPDIIQKQYSSIRRRLEQQLMKFTIPQYIQEDFLRNHADQLFKVVAQHPSVHSFAQLLLRIVFGHTVFLNDELSEDEELDLLCLLAAQNHAQMDETTTTLLQEYLRIFAQRGSVIAKYLQDNPIQHAQDLVVWLLLQNYPEDLRRRALATLRENAPGHLEELLERRLQELSRPHYNQVVEIVAKIAVDLHPIVNALAERVKNADEFRIRASGLIRDELRIFMELAAQQPHSCDLQAAERVFGQLPQWDKAVLELRKLQGERVLHELYRDTLPETLEDWIHLFMKTYLPTLGSDPVPLTRYNRGFASFLEKHYTSLAVEHPLFAPNWVRHYYELARVNPELTLIMVIIDGLTVKGGLDLVRYLERQQRQASWEYRLETDGAVQVGLAALPTITDIARRALILGSNVEAVPPKMTEEELFTKVFSNGMVKHIKSGNEARTALAHPASAYCLIYRPIDGVTHAQFVDSEDVDEVAVVFITSLLSALQKAIQEFSHLNRNPENTLVLITSDHGQVEIPERSVAQGVKSIRQKYKAEPNHCRLLKYPAQAYQAKDLEQALGADWIVVDPTRYHLPGPEQGGVGYLVPRKLERVEGRPPSRVHGGFSLEEALVPLVPVRVVPSRLDEIRIEYKNITGMEFVVKEERKIELLVSNLNRFTLQEVHITIPGLGLNSYEIGILPPYTEQEIQKFEISVCPAQARPNVSLEGYLEFSHAGRQHRRWFGQGQSIPVFSKDLGETHLDQEFDDLFDL